MFLRKNEVILDASAPPRHRLLLLWCKNRKHSGKIYEWLCVSTYLKWNCLIHQGIFPRKIAWKRLPMSFVFERCQHGFANWHILSQSSLEGRFDHCSETCSDFHSTGFLPFPLPHSAFYSTCWLMSKYNITSVERSDWCSFPNTLPIFLPEALLPLHHCHFSHEILSLEWTQGDLLLIPLSPSPPRELPPFWN